MLLFHSAAAQKICLLFTALLDISLGLLECFLKSLLLFSPRINPILKAWEARFPFSRSALRTLMLQAGILLKKHKCTQFRIKWLVSIFTSSFLPPPTSFFFLFSQQIGITAKDLWTKIWSETTCPPLRAMFWSSCVDLLPWSSTRAFPTWTNWAMPKTWGLPSNGGWYFSGLVRKGRKNS